MLLEIKLFIVCMFMILVSSKQIYMHNITEYVDISTVLNQGNTTHSTEVEIKLIERYEGERCYYKIFVVGNEAHSCYFQGKGSCSFTIYTAGVYKVSILSTICFPVLDHPFIKYESIMENTFRVSNNSVINKRDKNNCLVKGYWKIKEKFINQVEITFLKFSDDSIKKDIDKCKNHECNVVGFLVNGTNLGTTSPFQNFDSTDYFSWITDNCNISRNTNSIYNDIKQFGKILIAGTSRTRTIFYDIADYYNSNSKKGKVSEAEISVDETALEYYTVAIPEGPPLRGNSISCNFPIFESWAKKTKEFCSNRKGQDRYNLVVFTIGLYESNLFDMAYYERCIKKYFFVVAKHCPNDIVVFKTEEAMHNEFSTNKLNLYNYNDARIQFANSVGKRLAIANNISVFDSHKMTSSRPDGCVDGLHYYAYDPDRLSKFSPTKECGLSMEQICWENFKGNHVSKSVMSQMLSYSAGLVMIRKAIE